MPYCMVAPSGKNVDMPINGGFVGMVDREEFDEFLRERAADSGAVRRTGVFESIDHDAEGVAVVNYRMQGAARGDEIRSVRARAVIGADGAASAVARQSIPGAERVRYVYAYHEIVRSPREGERDAAGKVAGFDGTRCDVYYQGPLSPDFYSWIFPHGDTTSVGTGTANKGFSIRNAVGALRESAAKARRSRCVRCASGTTAATWCWPATPQAWWRRRPAKASTMQWPEDGWQATPWKPSWRHGTRARWPAPASGS